MDKVVGLLGMGRSPARCCGDLVFEPIIRLMKCVVIGKQSD
jgi:hypothetical protein